MNKLNVIWWVLLLTSLAWLCAYIETDNETFLIISNVNMSASLVVVGLQAVVQAIKGE